MRLAGKRSREYRVVASSGRGERGGRLEDVQVKRQTERQERGERENGNTAQRGEEQKRERGRDH